MNSSNDLPESTTFPVLSVKIHSSSVVMAFSLPQISIIFIEKAVI
jgi:hypothetical protein